LFFWEDFKLSLDWLFGEVSSKKNLIIFNDFQIGLDSLVYGHFSMILVVVVLSNLSHWLVRNLILIIAI
jgi:hypothetical protein